MALHLEDSKLNKADTKDEIIEILMNVPRSLTYEELIILARSKKNQIGKDKWPSKYFGSILKPLLPKSDGGASKSYHLKY